MGADHPVQQTQTTVKQWRQLPNVSLMNKTDWKHICAPDEMHVFAVGFTTPNIDHGHHGEVHAGDCVKYAGENMLG